MFWLLGATDGHAKNFSIRLAPGGRFRLTPLYDIVSVQPNVDARQISHNQMKLAMAVGTNRHYVVNTIAGLHFVQTANLCSLPRTMAAAVIEEIGDTAKDKIQNTLDKLPGSFPGAIAESIVKAAKRRINTLTTISTNAA